jgi:hypothetical protein
MTFKGLFGVLAVAWILLWLASAVTIGSMMGDSIPQLLLFLGMALLPPTILYFLLFEALPQVLKRFRLQ